MEGWKRTSLQIQRILEPYENQDMWGIDRRTAIRVLPIVFGFCHSTLTFSLCLAFFTLSASRSLGKRVTRFGSRLLYLLSPIAIEYLKDMEGATTIIGNLLVQFIRLVIVCSLQKKPVSPFNGPTPSDGMSFGSSSILIFLGRSSWFSSSLASGYSPAVASALDWTASLGALVLPQPLGVPFEGKTSWLAGTQKAIELTPPPVSILGCFHSFFFLFPVSCFLDCCRCVWSHTPLFI
jgi:hypothetical protein